MTIRSSARPFGTCYLDEQDRDDRIACLRKQTLSTDNLSLVWATLSHD
jgi:hypothetical protein